MHVCQEAKLSSKVRCPICGQDFLIYAESGVSAVDTMSRRGEVALRKRGFQYEVSCGSTAQVANQATADQPSECNT